MITSPIAVADAAEELLRRRGARAELEKYCELVDLPGRPVDEAEEDFVPVETALALHHRVMCRAIQRTMERPYGRLLIFAPPGSAKSTYVSVGGTTWAMGKWPGTRVIMVSHGSKLAAKQSKRARQLARSGKYRRIFDATLPADQRAADEWALTNGSSFMSGGILSGVTGNRAEGGGMDDPHASREEAESETLREKGWGEWMDSIRTRLVPGGWAIGVLTRWHERDWAGQILPEGWDGESGVFKGSDGLDWEVVSLRAKVEDEGQAANDPLGRGVGEYLWPEWFGREHWLPVDPAMGSVSARSMSGKRAWSSLYQQTPKPNDGVLFKREDFRWYKPGEIPSGGIRYMASDWAVTARTIGNDPDYTEHGVCEVVPGDGNDEGRLYLVDWVSAQAATNVTVAAWGRMAKKWRPRLALGEKGVIENAVGPMVERWMRENSTWVSRELMPTIGDKVARVSGFQGLVAAGRVYLPEGAAWAEGLVGQLCGFPNVRYDDKVDVCGLFGRAWDMMREGRGPEPDGKPPGVEPFSIEWLMSKDEAESEVDRRYYR